MSSSTLTRVRRAGPRGWAVPGGGRPAWLQAPPGFRGTTVQVCGLWPFAAGAGTPMVGVPLGRHLVTGATVCGDPVSWFMRAALISNPSMFTLGLPGLGKSSLTRRMCLGLAGYGVMPMVLGDLRPDYVPLIRELGGQVIPVGRGRGQINVLDPGEASTVAHRLVGRQREEIVADLHGRKVTMVTALLTISRKSQPTDTETALIDRAIRILVDRSQSVPVMSDLYDVIESAPEDLRQVVLDRGKIKRYQDATRNLQMSLRAMESGALGEMFSGQTSVPMDVNRPVVFDASSIGDNEHDLKAAALMACWSTGFGAINVSHTLADAGLERRRYHFVVMDELWQALRAGAGMVDRVDSLTRLNRAYGVGMSMISHTLADLKALPNKEDQEKAKGFIERSGMVITAGLPRAEMPELSEIVHFSEAERKLVTSWNTPGQWSGSDDAGTRVPPGRGKFLIKVGERPGIPFKTDMTDCERSVNDTNTRWRNDVDVDEQLQEALTPDPGEQEWS